MLPWSLWVTTLTSSTSSTRDVKSNLWILRRRTGENSKKRPRLSLSLKNRRFASPLNANEMTKVCEGFTPQNTTKNTDCQALRVFQEWQKQRDGDRCPSDLLERHSAEKLNYWLYRFVVECRRASRWATLSFQCFISTLGWITSILWF